MEEDHLTLRDHFAMAALQGLVANGTRYVTKGGNSADHARRTAGLAYELADAMLAERAEIAENPPPLE